MRTRPTYEQWDDGIGEFGGFDYSDEGAATMTDGGPELTPETIGNIAKNGSNRGYFQKAIEGGRAHQASLEILDTITSSSSEGSRVIDDIAADIARDAIEGLKSNVGNLDGTEASQQKRVKERSFELTQEWYDKLPENAKFPENDLVGSGVKQGFSYNQRGDYFEYIISKEGQIYDRLFFGNSGDLISINFDQKLGDRILERLTRTFTTQDGINPNEQGKRFIEDIQGDRGLLSRSEFVDKYSKTLESNAISSVAELSGGNNQSRRK